MSVGVQACAPVQASIPTNDAAESQAVSFLLYTDRADSPATLTPFQPLDPTRTPRNTATLKATPTAAHKPSKTPAPTRTPQELEKIYGDLPEPEGVLNILVLGSDLRPGGGYRTDVIMLVSIHPEDPSVRVVSFPRDLYVTIPGWGMNRINTVLNYGGFNLMADTFQTNFGIRPQHYIMTTFDGFIHIVDSLEGVNVEAEKPLIDQCDLPQMDALGKCSVEPGTVHMDGATALWYVRSRFTTSDFDRTRRAQEVLKAIFARVLSIDGLLKVPELYETYREHVDTDLKLDDILPLLPMAAKMTDGGEIRRFSIGPGQVWDYIDPYGSMVLWPNLPAVQQTINEAVSGQ